MNLWIKKTGPILALALFLFTCEEPGEIGLELDPDVGNFVGDYVEIPLKTSTIKSEPYYISKLDSIIQRIEENDDGSVDTIYRRLLRGTGAMLFGKYNDPNYGDTRVSVFTQIVPEDLSDSIPPNADFISLDLSLYLTNFHGKKSDLQSQQTIGVHELTESVGSENFSNTSYSFDETELANRSFSLDEDEDTRVLNIELPESLGMRFLNDIKDTSQDISESDANFTEYFNGFAFIPDENNSILFRINPLVQPESRMTLTYKSDDDTASYTFVMTRYFSQDIETDYSGTELDGLVENEPTQTNNIYLNAYDGIVTEMDFAPFIEFADSVGPMVINRAELIIDTISLVEGIRVPNNVNIFNYDNSVFDIRDLSLFSLQAEYPLPINSTYVNRFNPRVDTVNNKVSYNISFTNYLNSILEVNPEDLKLLIAPSSYGRVPNQLVFDKNKLKLRIYYSYLQNNQ